MERQNLVAHATLDCGISLARVHDGLLLLVLLVGHHKRAAVGSHKFDFYFVESAVVRAGRWRIRDAVLVAKVRHDVVEDARNFAIELREPRISTRELSKGT